MNREIFLLFKIQLMNQYRLNDLKKGNTGKSGKNLSMLIGLAVMALTFALYSFILANGLAGAGLAGLIPAYAVTATGIAAFFFTLLKTNGLLFGYRDYDLLMSLPVSTASVIASRFLAVYFTNMLFTLTFMLPMGAGYVLWVKPGIFFYLSWLVGMLTAPLIPTTVGIALGALVMAFASRFKYAKALSTLLSLLLVTGSLLLSMSGGALGREMNSPENMVHLGEVIYRSLCRYYPPAELFSAVFRENGLVPLLLFAGLSLFIYYLFTKLLSLRYKAINSGVSGHIKRTDYRLTALSAASPLKALYRKELKRFFSCSSWLVNAGSGILMTLLLVVGLTVMGPVRMEEMLGIPGFSSRLPVFLPWAMAIMLAMSCTSCSALSLEGKNLWILQSGPLSLKTIFDSKILVNLTLTLPVAVLGGFVLALRLMPEPGDLLLLFAAPITGAFFTAVWGMFLNIKMPRYDWETEMTVVKQSAAVFFGMIGGALIMLTVMGLSFLPLGMARPIWSFLLLLVTWVAIALLYRSVCHTKTLA